MTSFQELWKSLLLLITVERVSLRGASAAETQVEAAMTQAEFAVAQSHEAATQSTIAREIVEADSLGAAKARIDQAAPGVVIAVPLMDRAPPVRASSSDKNSRATPRGGNAEIARAELYEVLPLRSLLRPVRNALQRWQSGGSGVLTGLCNFLCRQASR